MSSATENQAQKRAHTEENGDDAVDAKSRKVENGKGSEIAEADTKKGKALPKEVEGDEDVHDVEDEEGDVEESSGGESGAEDEEGDLDDEDDGVGDEDEGDDAEGDGEDDEEEEEEE